MVVPVSHDWGWHTPEPERLNPYRAIERVGGMVQRIAELEAVEVTAFGDPEPRFLPAGLKPTAGSWTEFSIEQSRQDYLVDRIFWWQFEDEVWAALHGEYPARHGLPLARDRR